MVVAALPGDLRGGCSPGLLRKDPLTDVCLRFRLIGEKIGNVGRGINIAIVNCKLLNIFFKTFLKAL